MCEECILMNVIHHWLSSMDFYPPWPFLHAQGFNVDWKFAWYQSPIIGTNMIKCWNASSRTCTTPCTTLNYMSTLNCKLGTLWHDVNLPLSLGPRPKHYYLIIIFRWNIEDLAGKSVSIFQLLIKNWDT